MTKIPNFDNSRWRMAAILKIVYLNIWAVNYPISIKFGTIYKFPFRAWKFDMKSKFLKFKMADRRHIENRFWLYIGAIFSVLCKFRNWDEEITCRYRTVDQNGNFHRFKMADGRHFENSFIFISQSELSDFGQIWYADANFDSENGYLIKIDFCSNSRWRTDAIMKIVLAIFIGRLTWNSELRWRITCR